MLFNLLTWLYRAFVVKPYETLTGEHFLGEAQNLPGRYSDGQRPRWVKFVGDIGLTLSSAPHLPPGTNIIHRFYAKPPFISDNIGAWIGNDNPAVSARRWVNHFKDELNAFKSIPGRKKAIDGPGNEVGQGELYAAFCFELAKILYREFDGMLLAAFGASTGSYNEAQAVTAQGLPDRDMIRQQIIRNARILSESHDPLAAQSLQSEVVEILRLEAQNARTIADTYVIPLIREGIPVYLSLHAYASLYPMVWHGDHRQKPQIQQIWNSGARGDIFGLNDFMPASVLDAPNPPATYTGFGWIRLLWHFKHNHQIDLKKIGLLITEGGIVDNVGDPGIGTVAAGWRQWVERGLWERLRIGNDSYEMVAARGLLYIEQQCRVFLPLLLDMATTPFTDTDHNKGTRWHIEYRTIDVMALFKSLVRALGGLPTEPPPTGCQISASKGLAINIRQQPSTDAAIVGELAIADTIEPLATVRDTDGKIWYRTALGFIASFAAITVSGCEGLPDETPPPDNGNEEPIMAYLAPTLLDPDGAIITQTVNTFNPPIVHASGGAFLQPDGSLLDPIADKFAELSHPGIMQWWMQYTPSAGDSPPDFGNFDTFIQHLQGVPDNEKVRIWMEAVNNENRINNIRRERFKADQPTGVNPVENNPDHNRHVYITLPHADSVPFAFMSDYMAFAAAATKAMWEGRTINNWPIRYELKTATLTRDISGDDVDTMWNWDSSRALLEQLAATGSVMVINRKIDGLFADYRLSEIFPLKTWDILASKGWLSRIRFYLKFEYRNGWRSQNHTPAQVLSDMYLLNRELQKHSHVIGGGLLHRLNPEAEAAGDQWKIDHDLTPLLADYAAILAGTKLAPVVDWQPELPGNGNGGDPEPEPPSGCIPLPFARMLARELRPFLVK